jgi:hypothetical protein
VTPFLKVTRPELLEMQQQGLRIQLRCLLQHRQQHALPDLGERIGAGTPVTAALRLALGMQFPPINPLGAPHQIPTASAASC